jgi:hypothetical protein
MYAKVFKKISVKKYEALTKKLDTVSQSGYAS